MSVKRDFSGLFAKSLLVVENLNFFTYIVSISDNFQFYDVLMELLGLPFMTLFRTTFWHL